MKQKVLGMSLRTMALFLLTVVSLAVRAEVKVDIGTFTGGTVSVKSQGEPAADGSVEVTITVTPDEGYQISKDNIVVVATRESGEQSEQSESQEQSLTRVDLGEYLQLQGDEPQDPSLPREYNFTVPAGLGAWVKEANFRPYEKMDNGEPLQDGAYYRIGFGDKEKWYLWPSTTKDADGHNYLTTFNGIEAPALEATNGNSVAYDAFGPDYSLWQLKRVEAGSEDNTQVCYQLFNKALQQYVVWSTSEAGQQRAVHLETIAEDTENAEEPVDWTRTYFRLDGLAPNYRITPVEAAAGTTLNSQGGDKPYLSATGNSQEPNDDGNYGLIHIYSLGTPVWTFTKEEPTSGELGDKGVAWALAKTDGAETMTLTISGKGSASTVKGDEVPWSAYMERITEATISVDITELGKGLLRGCTNLKKLVILNGNQVLTLSEDALPTVEGLTVDVPGNLYNEYKTTDGWKSLSVTSETGIEMTGVAFGEKNSYDTYGNLDQPVLIPSVLKAFVAEGIEGNTVVLTQVSGKVIPTGVAVLLQSESVKDDDFRTAAVQSGDSDVEESDVTTILHLAPVGGLPVALGEVYLLYNDVFYLSQAGTIPAGGVYLKLPETVSSRSRLNIQTTASPADTDATGITTLSPDEPAASVWHSLDGRRLSSAPTRKGIYVRNGRKLVIR